MVLIALTLVVACGTRTAKPVAESPSPRAEFSPALPPTNLSVAEQREYLRWHYWDGFSFADTAQLLQVDTMRFMRLYAQYIYLLSEYPTDARPIDSLMRRAATSRPMLDFFAHLAEEVSHNPNSPLRNDEFYIPVLQAQLASAWYDEYERLAPEYTLHEVSQNRLGARANNFRYTLRSGASSSLYALKAPYTLLYIHNPRCALCEQIRTELIASKMLSEMVARGELQILALYPDADLTAWQAHYDQIPSSWINAYDRGCVISQQRLYNLSAIPALYLLDREKRVLVKDATEVGLIEQTILRLQQKG